MEHQDSAPKCFHRLPATKYTCRKGPNIGREFYRCPKPIGDEQCSYFEWVNDVQPNQPSSSQEFPPTPQSERPSASQGYTLPPPLTPSPTVLAKRGSSALDESADPQTSPASQKRTKTWAGAIAAQHDEFEDIPDEHDHTEHPTASWPPQTPKKPSRRPSNTAGTLPTPSPMVFNKFKPSAIPSGGSSLNRPMTLGNIPSSSQETLDGEDHEELSADSIAKMLRSLGDIPAYIRKLERKKIAAEKSRDIKAAKIVDLEKEVERLKAKEKELESLVEMLEKDS